MDPLDNYLMEEHGKAMDRIDLEIQTLMDLNFQMLQWQEDIDAWGIEIEKTGELTSQMKWVRVERERAHLNLPSPTEREAILEELDEILNLDEEEDLAVTAEKHEILQE